MCIHSITVQGALKSSRGIVTLRIIESLGDIIDFTDFHHTRDLMSITI